MAKLNQTSITGSLTVSGSTILMPNLTASVFSGSTGQMWIDDSAGLQMKFTRNTSYAAGAWAAGANLINPNHANFAAGFGTQNAGAFAGGNGSPNAQTDKTEEYDGTTWSAGGTLSNSRYKFAGAGTLDSGFVAGGEAPGVVVDTEEYNGTSWSTGGNLIQCRYGIMAAGASSNAGLGFGGCRPGAWVSCTEEYNGTSWSAQNAMPTARSFGFGDGIQNSALAAGGYCGSPAATRICASTDHYDGINWSRGGNMIFKRTSGATAADCEYAALAMGGTRHPGDLTCVEEYDGTSWSVLSGLSTGKRRLSGFGNSCSALAGAGLTPSDSVTSEEWTCAEGASYSQCVATWTRSVSLIAARRYVCGSGTQGAALASGGRPLPAAGGLTCVEEFDGVSWSGGGCLSNARYAGAVAGTQNATFYAGGENSPSCANYSSTEEYDGSSWSAGGSLIIARRNIGGAGTLSAGLAIGGIATPGTCASTEEYDGSSWSNGGALITARHGGIGAGTQNSTVFWGGNPQSSCTEEYDGSSWSSGGALPFGQYVGGGAGTQNDAIAFTANEVSPSQLTYTLAYDGSSWSTTQNMNVHRANSGGGGTGDAAFATGGVLQPANTTNTGETELWDRVCICNATYQCYLPLGSWSAGGALITARKFGASAGTQNSAFFAGGNTPTILSCTEEYDGSTWSAGGALIIARQGLSAAGTQNSGLVFGGYNAPDYRTNTEEYDGSTWSAGGALITARCAAGSATAGTQDAALMFTGLGNAADVRSCTEEYNGTAWSAGGATIHDRYTAYGAGIQNDALVFGGYDAPTDTGTSEHYNGTSWALGSTMNNSRRELGGAGTTSDSALAFGGNPSLQCSEEYDGTWRETSRLINGNQFVAGNGSQHAALAVGGQAPGISSCTEEYNQGLVYYNLDPEFKTLS